MLEIVARYMAVSLLGVTPGTQLADALELVIYDTVKIFLLLTIVIYVVAITRSYFTPEKTKRIHSHKKEFIGNILAALLGVVTPVCSCSAVPHFNAIL